MVDEFHLLFDSRMIPAMSLRFKRWNSARFVVTQAIGRGKRGKPVFAGTMRDAKTGLSFPLAPKKFFPAQVLRRNAAELA